MASSKRPVRIAGCSGSAMDRRDAMYKLASNCPNDHLDVIVGDWLSEINMTTKGAGKTDSPDEVAYEPTFLESLEPALPHIFKHKIKIAVNAGATDTERLSNDVRAMVSKHNLDLKVAWIEGDEALPVIKHNLSTRGSEYINTYTGEKLGDWKFEPIFAQAYLGGLGIAAAFQEGADIVLCGRVSDASPLIGSAYWFHGWQRSDLRQLANALIAGHLVECSSYVTGGNYSGFKALEESGWENLGYPIAEISPNGEVVITKNKGSGGEISVNTCTSQLLYEIQGPWYFNSDVVADITNIAFEQLETDRVALRGVNGWLPPATTKVGITAKGGYQAEMHWFIVGLDVKAKAMMMERNIRKLMEPYMSRYSVLAFTMNGSSPENSRNQNESTIDFRVLAQAPNADDLSPQKFARPCIDCGMATYPGATPHLDLRTAFPKPIYEYYVTTVFQRELKHKAHLTWIKDKEKSSIFIPAPSQTMTWPRQQPSHPETFLPVSNDRQLGATQGNASTDAAGGWAELPASQGRSVLRETFGPWGRTVRGPLGWIVHGRSGDKGSDCNVGFWVRHQNEWDWLRHILSTKKIKELLGDEYKEGKPIDRFEFVGMRAVHFLLHEHLDRGVSCTTSYDSLGKNVAEFLRARWVDLPVKFLEKPRI